MKQLTCKSCKFYRLEGEHEGKKYGFCFRYPPTVLEPNKSASPVVMADLIACGEHKAKPRK